MLKLELMTADQIVDLIQDTIKNWHIENENRDPDFVIVTDEIRRIKPLNEHRDDLRQVVKELANTNIEIWHEEDKARLPQDEIVVKAKRNIDALNQHRNDLMDEIDEIICDQVNNK